MNREDATILMNAAADGDTILLRSGSYGESVSIDGKGLRVVGLGSCFLFAASRNAKRIWRIDLDNGELLAQQRVRERVGDIVADRLGREGEWYCHGK